MGDEISDYETIEVRAIIRGMVQGVGFRMTAQYHAVKLGVAGTVRNLNDGSVEVFAAGKRPVIEAFLETLRHSPGPGRVDSLQREDLVPAKTYDGFKIIHS